MEKPLTLNEAITGRLFLLETFSSSFLFLAMITGTVYLLPVGIIIHRHVKQDMDYGN